MPDIIIGKVNDKHGWLGNMAPFPVEHDGQRWLTTEALFQALRFDDQEIRSQIRSRKSPMAAKMLAKKHKARMVIEPMFAADLDNMRLCLKLKMEQHPELREMLLQTGEALIVEDCTRRQRGSGLFWGAAFLDGQWHGQNWLGRLWMELRQEQSPSVESKMPSIRDELCRFIRLNEQDQWVGAYDALEQLESFGDDLIPGLIQCLSDGHPDVRHQAVRLLGAARPRSDVAVPALVERMGDEDWLIVTSTMLYLGDFGPMAAAAIPQIEGWLESPNEYLRLLAATTIVKLDPSRTEFLPMIRQATNSDDLMVRSSALDFFGDPLA